MPHIIVKMYSGRSEEMKMKMADKITQAITESLGVGESTVSIAVEEIERENWNEAVYQPDIVQKANQLYKKPGYML